jgi:hypothetical protein
VETSSAHRPCKPLVLRKPQHQPGTLYVDASLLSPAPRAELGAALPRRNTASDAGAEGPDRGEYATA